MRMLLLLSAPVCCGAVTGGLSSQAQGARAHTHAGGGRSAAAAELLLPVFTSSVFTSCKVGAR